MEIDAADLEFDENTFLQVDEGRQVDCDRRDRLVAVA